MLYEKIMLVSVVLCPSGGEIKAITEAVVSLTKVTLEKFTFPAESLAETSQVLLLSVEVRPVKLAPQATVVLLAPLLVEYQHA